MKNKTPSQTDLALCARGRSHLRYFNRFASFSDKTVKIINLNTLVWNLTLLRYWPDVDASLLDECVAQHVKKKAKKHGIKQGSFFYGVLERLTRSIVKAKTVLMYGVIANLKPQYIGVWNGQKMPSSAVVVAAKLVNIPVVYFENGLLPNSVTCDWRGVNCENSLPNSPAFYRQFSTQNAVEQQLVQRQSKTKKGQGICESRLPKRYIFVPFQVETDSQVVRNSPWITSMADFYRVLEDALPFIDDDVCIIIKEHPSENQRYDHLHHKNERIMFCNQSTTDTLIGKAEALITLNSTVGLEGILKNRKVITLGNACYGIDGLVLNATSMSEFRLCLERLSDFTIDEDVRSGFIYFLDAIYTIPGNPDEPSDMHYSRLSARIDKNDKLAEVLAFSI